MAAQHADEVGRYIEWSKTLGEHVQQLADQHADELKEYVGWSEHMGEQHGRLNAHVEKNRPRHTTSYRGFWTRGEKN